MKMKNPLENLFKKVQKQGKDAVVTGAAFLAMGGTAMGADQPNQKIEDGTPQKTESVTQVKTQDQETAQMGEFEAAQQRMEAIRKLEDEKSRIEVTIQKLTGELSQLQVDFRNSYERGIEFSGIKSKAGMGDFEIKISEIASKMAKEKVGKYDITSPDAVNGLVGILLSGNGPLGKESEHLTQVLNHKLGSDVMVKEPLVGTYGDLKNDEYLKIKKPKFGEYMSEDMTLHKNLGEDPRLIVEWTLKIVKEQHKIDKIDAQIDSLKGGDLAQGNG